MKSASILLIAGSVLAAPLTAQPVLVERMSDRPTATVLVTQADFASPQARTMLGHRIRDAIEFVCGSYATIESYQMPERDRCWNDARAQADGQLRTARWRVQTLIAFAAR